MNLSKECEKKLDHWLTTKTWHKNHTYDMGRWYDFIEQFRTDHGYDIDETDLYDKIRNKERIPDTATELLEIIRRRISLADHILSFLKHTRAK